MKCCSYRLLLYFLFVASRFFLNQNELFDRKEYSNQCDQAYFRFVRGGGVRGGGAPLRKKRNKKRNSIKEKNFAKTGSGHTLRRVFWNFVQASECFYSSKFCVQKLIHVDAPFILQTTDFKLVSFCFVSCRKLQ